MLLSTDTGKLFKTLGEERGIAAAADAGFDALDYSIYEIARSEKPNFSEFVLRAEKCRALAEENGLCFNQAHARFAVYKEGEDEYNRITLAGVKEDIRIAGIVGAKTIVVHPFEIKNGGKYMDMVAQKEANLRFYRELESIAIESGVRIALENLNGWDYDKHCYAPTVCSYAAWLNEYVDELNPDVFTVCLDVGHSNITGEAPHNAVRELGRERLTALHLHDNSSFGDDHHIPFFGIIDWYELCKALGSIDYKGDFTYEASTYIAFRDEKELPRALRYMANLGRHLMQIIDEYRPVNG